MQYYGILEDRQTMVYVAMSAQEVVDYAKSHPNEGIVFVADRFNILYEIEEV